MTAGGVTDIQKVLNSHQRSLCVNLRFLIHCERVKNTPQYKFFLQHFGIYISKTNTSPIVCFITKSNVLLLFFLHY